MFVVRQVNLCFCLSNWFLCKLCFDLLSSLSKATDCCSGGTQFDLLWIGCCSLFLSVRFLICLSLDFVFFYILIWLAESSPLIVFLVLKFAPPCKLSHLNVICRHRKQAGIRFVGFILNAFHLWQFLHHIVNLSSLFLDIICQLVNIFLYVAFSCSGKCFVLGLVENCFRSSRSMSSSVFLCFFKLFLVSSYALSVKACQRLKKVFFCLFP